MSRDAAITALCRTLALLFDLWRRVRPQPTRKIGLYGKAREAQPGVGLVRRRATGVPGNIAVIKPCCLGDVALSSAAVADLRHVFPDAFITYAVGAWARPAIANNPNIDGTIAWEISAQKATENRFAQYQTLIRTLRNGRYDCAVVLDRSPLVGLLAALAGVPVRVGIDSAGRGFAHTIRVPLLPDPEHEADLYRRVVRDFADAYGRNVAAVSRLAFVPSPAAARAADRVLARLNTGNRPLVVVHPGGGVNPVNAVLAKRWPAANFAAIIARLFAAPDAPPLVLVTGDGGDADAVAALLGELARIAPDLRQNTLADADITTDVVSAVAAFDFDMLGALCGRAALFVGNDTGLMHIATAQGAAVVAIFGPSDPRMYGPYHPACGGFVAPAHSAQWGKRLEEYRALSAAAGGITAVPVDAVWQAVAGCLPLRVR